MRIPDFQPDGYLPAGVYLATEAEVSFRFGWNRQRRRMVLRLRRWIELARLVEAPRLFIDGSFVAAKELPNDVDAVVLLPADFELQVASGVDPAIELEEMLLSRRPEELFAAEDASDWDEWIRFFGRTREADNRRKGVVEIEL